MARFSTAPAAARIVEDTSIHALLPWPPPPPPPPRHYVQQQQDEDEDKHLFLALEEARSMHQGVVFPKPLRVDLFGGGGDEATSHLCMTDYPHTPPHNHTRTPHTAREAVEAKGREAGRVHHPSNLARPRPPAHPPPPPWAPAAPASNRQPTHSQGDDQITTAPAPPPRPPPSPPPPLHDDGLYLVFPAPLLLLPVPSPRHDLLLLLLLDPRPNQGRGRHTCGPPSLKRGHCGHWDRGSQARILQGDLSFSFG